MTDSQSDYRTHDYAITEAVPVETIEAELRKLS